MRKVRKRYPNNTRIETIGQSYCGRDIDMIILSKDCNTEKFGVLIDAGIHAREWITHTSALFVIHYLMRNRELLSFFDFYIIPCLNPDGYVYTHTCVSTDYFFTNPQYRPFWESNRLAFHNLVDVFRFIMLLIGKLAPYKSLSKVSITFFWYL